MQLLTSLVKVFEPSGANDALWSSANKLTLSTVATPQALQSSEYIRDTYHSKTWGVTDTVTLRTWQTRHKLTILAQWKADKPTKAFNGPDSFLDRVAFLFPHSDMTPLGLMGSKEAPATIWTWRSDNKLERLTASGPGSIKMEDNAGLRADAQWKDGTWRVMITGPNDFKNRPIKFSVAVWSGNSSERAGQKSFVPDWISVEKMK